MSAAPAVAEHCASWSGFFVSRAGRASEVCATLLELHQQSEGSPLSPISARSVPGYGGSDRTGGETEISAVVPQNPVIPLSDLSH